MTQLFNELLYRPLFNLLIGLYNIVPGGDFGITIILLTVLIRLLFSPLSLRTLRSQQEMQKIGPEVEAIKEKYKNDRNAQSVAIMQLYKEKNINPLSGCLPLLIQLPILIALYKAFMAGLKPESLSLLYSFVENQGTIGSMFLGMLDITEKSHAVAIMAGVLQFFQSKLATASASQTTKKLDDTAAMVNTQMLYFFPVMIVVISWNLPAGITLYWVATTLFSIIEQFYIRRSLAHG